MASARKLSGHLPKRAIALSLALGLSLFARASANAQNLPEPWRPYRLPDPLQWPDRLACADEAVFVRGRSRVARFDGAAWALMAPIPDGSSDRTFATNRQGTRLFITAVDAILHWSEGRWVVHEAPARGRTPRDLISLDGVTAHAVGKGRIIAWNGTQYAAYDGGTWRLLLAIWGLSERDF